jgi:LysM repeat protein
MNLVGIARFLRRAAPASALILLGLGACKGPDHSPRVVPLNIADKAQILPQLGDGPRDENARRELEKQAQRVAAQLFRAEPMARDVPPESQSETPEPAEAPVGERPAWADGVEEPANAGENDLPQGWPVEVRRGETPALLAQWSGQDAKEIVFVNAEALGNRKWLKVGDRITVHMSANRKVAFDRLRDVFQRERVESFFSNKFFKEVVVYRVKKGEFIAAAAKRYGDVPLWLIEEFNQIDFRSLQPGDEILIPVVSELPAGVRQPPPLRVVDESGHPLASTQVEALSPKIYSDFMAKARMAIDDSNVFMREGPMGAPGAQVPLAQPHAPQLQGVPNPVAPHGYPLPPAHIGHGVAPAGAVPQGQPSAYQPSVYQAQPAANAPSASPFGAPQVAYPAPAVEPSPAAPVPGAIPRDVVVKRGESLMHYVKWSRVTLSAIKAANPHLDPDRIFVGARIALPMSDEQYVEFVTARATWAKEKAEGGGEGAAPEDGKEVAKDIKKKADKTRSHTVKSGETATSIARAFRVEVKDLKAANPGLDLKRLKVGKKLVIPAKKKK